VKLLGQVPLKFLQLGFAALLYLSAMRLIWSSTPHQLLEGTAAIVFLIVVGFFAGVMSGLFGVGGGIVMVPALIIASGMDSLTARGTSLAVIVAWERRFKRRASDLGSGVGMEDLAFMAYEASQRSGIIVPASLDAFINSIENLEVVDGEPETFTVPAASGDN
jgi:uncharacterized membrane protein YfcA